MQTLLEASVQQRHTVQLIHSSAPRPSKSNISGSARRLATPPRSFYTQFFSRLSSPRCSRRAAGPDDALRYLSANQIDGNLLIGDADWGKCREGRSRGRHGRRVREKPEAGALSRGWGVFSYISSAGAAGAVWAGRRRSEEKVFAAPVVCVGVRVLR